MVRRLPGRSQVCCQARENGVIGEAHRGGYGLPMEAFDLVVVGRGAPRVRVGRESTGADVHRQEVIPARRRHYMTGPTVVLAFQSPAHVPPYT